MSRSRNPGAFVSMVIASTRHPDAQARASDASTTLRPPGEVQLIPERAGHRGDLLNAYPERSRARTQARRPWRTSHTKLPVRMEDPRIADRREQQGHAQGVSITIVEVSQAEMAPRARPEQHVVPAARLSAA
jgi:hypothetical protein